MATIPGDAHERLRKRLDEFPLGLPRDDRIIEVLRLAFTEQEAAMLEKFTSFQKLVTIEEFAKEHGYPVDVVKGVFYSLAKRDLILYRKKGGKEEFCLRPFVVGMYEALFCNWRSQDPRIMVPLAITLEGYFMNVFFKSISNSRFPWARVLPSQIPLDRLKTTNPETFQGEESAAVKFQDSLEKSRGVLTYGAQVLAKKTMSEGLGGAVKMIQEDGKLMVDTVAQTVTSFFGTFFPATSKPSPRPIPPTASTAPKTPVTRSAGKEIPVNTQIPVSLHVHPHEEVRHYIDESTSITVTDCACRKHHALLETPSYDVMKGSCEHAIANTCIQLFYNGEEANEFNSLGGRVISKQECIDIIETCEKDGLVHTSFNSKERIEFICNCCSCCCGILGTVTRLHQNVGAFVASNFLPFLGETQCVKCGSCAKVCPMQAIEFVKGNLPTIHVDKCIGCGLCAVTCKQGALHMVKRKNAEPALDTVDAHLRFKTQKM